MKYAPLLVIFLLIMVSFPSGADFPQVGVVGEREQTWYVAYMDDSEARSFLIRHDFEFTNGDPNSISFFKLGADSEIHPSNGWKQKVTIWDDLWNEISMFWLNDSNTNYYIPKITPQKVYKASVDILAPPKLLVGKEYQSKILLSSELDQSNISEGSVGSTSRYGLHLINTIVPTMDFIISGITRDKEGNPQETVIEIKLGDYVDNEFVARKTKTIKTDENGRFKYNLMNMSYHNGEYVLLSATNQTVVKQKEDVWGLFEIETRHYNLTTAYIGGGKINIELEKNQLFKTDIPGAFLEIELNKETEKEYTGSVMQLANINIILVILGIVVVFGILCWRRRV